ncbi:hypothetical protein F5Y17DRAFT_269655 [Xylariaceae sp. FL0594]|nr:hypothetical protein F5Y17DRAFT_269655 [Xylariaceae sp. FL0594]
MLKPVDTMKLAFIPFALPAMASLIGDLPELCITAPLSTLHAGTSVLSAVIDSDVVQQCIATVEFTTLDFLPISYSFNNSSCPGSYAMSFVLPKDVPNGQAKVTWECAGLSPTCNFINMTGAVQTSTELVTVTGPSGTFVETVPTTFTILTTSAPMPSQEANTQCRASASCSSTGIATGADPQNTQFGPTSSYAVKTSRLPYNSLGTPCASDHRVGCCRTSSSHLRQHGHLM